MSFEEFAEKVITEIKQEFKNLGEILKGQKTMEGQQNNTKVDEASLNAHAANILRNHASKITGENAGIPQQPAQQTDAQPQAPANSTDTNSNQNVSESNQGNETTVPSTPTTATPTTNDGA